jgi:hypothetical protein
MDMQPMQARFVTQDQAESAIRKLTALRSDSFRLERAAAYDDVGTEATAYSSLSEDGFTASALAGSAIPYSSGGAEYTLSANVPGEAADQARTVILQAGGQIV